MLVSLERIPLALTVFTFFSGDNDEGKWVDDTNTRLVMGEDEQSQATGWTGKYHRAIISLTSPTNMG